MSIDMDNTTEDIEGVVSTVLDLFRKPVKQASLFYTRYYLVEIEDVTDLAMDHQLHLNRLYDGFLWYGVYSCAREVNHTDRFSMSEKDVKPSQARGGVSIPVQQFFFQEETERLEELLTTGGITEENARLYIDFIEWFRESGLFTSNNPEEVKGLIRGLEEEFNAMSEPDPFLEMSEEIFGKDRWWKKDFGGSAWSNLASSLLQYDSLTKTSFVDLCWSIEHNNGNWVNKIDLDKGEINAIGKISRSVRRNQNISSGMLEALMTRELDTLLEEKREGLFTKAKEYAFHYEPSLRQYDGLLPE